MLPRLSHLSLGKMFTKRQQSAIEIKKQRPDWMSVFEVTILKVKQ